jgi:sugar lactone lactonase YvrE
MEWHPGGQLQALGGTELSRPNGIDVSPDGRYVYVAAATREVIRFDRGTTPIGKVAVTTPMRPDNIHWDGSGKLLSAGPNPADSTACASPPCEAGWTAIEVDPETLAITPLGGADGSASMQRASAAMRVGAEIWVGSNEDRIARFPVL